MYASSLALRPSGWRHVAYGAGLVFIFVSVLLLPVTGWLLWCSSLPMLAACFLLLQKWQQPLSTCMLSVGQTGELHWQGGNLSQGVILPQSLICSWGIWLYWQDAQQIIHQRWLYQDNFSDADFRALARHCQLMRWQRTSV